ncbi:MAG: precorrin-6A reductase [Methanomassiliicoccaceae archaeon]|jgi:precorrin-6Y C5,15-methyltransferase (decarboxylating)|nr:precorrin-6A reductase [Methanomassiliicoccaceae archaeon]
MTDIIIFGGTTEGRTLSETLAENGLSVHVCVATEYGESLIQKSRNITVSNERLDADGMADLIKKKGVNVIVDATHPYAVIVSENIREACAAAGAEYIRLLRESSRTEGSIVTVRDISEAAEYLKSTTGNVLVATGSKELAKFTSINGYKERIFARVLSTPEVVEQCAKLGFTGRNLICMQGPFNEDINYGMMKQFDIRHMVTKDSGTPGGFDEKMRAARRANVNVILVGRPLEIGLPYDDVVKELSKRFSISIKKENKKSNEKNVWVIGIGMGGPKGMTVEAAEACRNADVIIGPKRMTEHVGIGKIVFNGYRSDEIISYIREHPELSNIAVVFSGDIGFYSGAKRLIEDADDEWNIIPICGISSVMYLCSKIRMPWQDVHLMNAHSADANMVGEIRRRKKVFSILGKGTDITRLCEKLIVYGLNDVKVTVGDRLGYPDEKIVTGGPENIGKAEFSDLSVVLIINDGYDRRYPAGIPDTEFIRGDVPMTKSEIRALTVSKLGLSDDSVVYDIGAGTGSVSIEMARVAVNGKVYSIEIENDALELIQKNKVRFCADNLEVIGGRAPDVLEGLPVPTHVFIGGSGGELNNILRTVIKKNPDVRIVINSVTLETIGETVKCIKELRLNEIETICVSVSRSRTTENAHLMIAQNPIYITVCEGLLSNHR